jgi:replicative DNA helicase
VIDHATKEEMAVLGSILIENASMSTAARYLEHSDFSQRSLGIIWQAMLAMSDKQVAIDTLTLTHYLEQAGMLIKAGGPAAVVEIMEAVPSAANVEHYATAVRERSIKRRLTIASEKIKEIATRASAAESVELAQRELGKIARKAAPSTVITLGQAAIEAYGHIQKVHEAGEEVTGISTGFSSLDKLLAGFHERELVIVAARPAMGKTALATSFAVTASKQGAGVLLFSLEMDARQLAMRVISTESDVRLQAMRTAQCVANDWTPLASAVNTCNDLPFSIVDESDLTISQLRTIAREENSKSSLRLIIVDYLQLLRAPGAERREREVAMISAGLKALAKELNVTVVALSQLNRGLESRPDKRPHLGDLRESGGLEQDADVVMFVYRDEYYNEGSDQKGMAELIVAKQRQGPTGTAMVGFVGSRTRFTNEHARKFSPGRLNGE